MFLGRIGDLRAGPGDDAKAVDLRFRGLTEMTARLGDAAALDLVRAHDALERRGLEAYGGREVKHTSGRGMKHVAGARAAP
jgi:hypothetical protein